MEFFMFESKAILTRILHWFRPFVQQLFRSYYPESGGNAFPIRFWNDWIRQSQRALNGQISPVTQMVTIHPAYCAEIKTIASI